MPHKKYAMIAQSGDRHRTVARPIGGTTLDRRSGLRKKKSSGPCPTSPKSPADPSWQSGRSRKAGRRRRANWPWISRPCAESTCASFALRGINVDIYKVLKLV